MGLTTLDSAVVIGFLHPDDVHHQAADALLGAVEEREDELMVSTVTYSEVLVAPLKRGAREAAAAEGFLNEFIRRVEPVSVEIARLAARIRAKNAGVSLPDAVIIATAEHHSADRVITADRRWKSVRGLHTAVEVLRP